jgi:hypothetical protein
LITAKYTTVDNDNVDGVDRIVGCWQSRLVGGPRVDERHPPTCRQPLVCAGRQGKAAWMTVAHALGGTRDDVLV